MPASWFVKVEDFIFDDCRSRRAMPCLTDHRRAATRLATPMRVTPCPSTPFRSVPASPSRALTFLAPTSLCTPTPPFHARPHLACRACRATPCAATRLQSLPRAALPATPRRSLPTLRRPASLAPPFPCHALPRRTDPCRATTGQATPASPRPSSRIRAMHCLPGLSPPSRAQSRRAMPWLAWPAVAFHTVPCTSAPLGDGPSLACLAISPCQSGAGRALPCLPAHAMPRLAGPNLAASRRAGPGQSTPSRA